MVLQVWEPATHHKSLGISTLMISNQLLGNHTSPMQYAVMFFYTPSIHVNSYTNTHTVENFLTFMSAHVVFMRTLPKWVSQILQAWCQVTQYRSGSLSCLMLWAQNISGSTSLWHSSWMPSQVARMQPARTIPQLLSQIAKNCLEQVE